MVRRSRAVLGLLVLLTLALFACETLKTSKPIFPIKEYERMLVGRLDANYIGIENCLVLCHVHDDIRRNLEASTMGAQLSEKSGLPLVDCESCHGPGSLAIDAIQSGDFDPDAEGGMHKNLLIDIRGLPAQAKSLICLKCHTGNATFNLHNWNADVHNINDVSCSDCHKVHTSYDLKVSPRETGEMCYRCHQEIQAEFSLPSHHPLPENRVFCTDCHDPHGSTTEHLLREETEKETCTECHAEKEGPFLYEHAESTEDCMRCHTPHGSVNNNLLTTQEPFLCLQCHLGHATASTSSTEGKGALYTKCTDCHSQIHGTDIPSAGGKGWFTQ